MKYCYLILFCISILNFQQTQAQLKSPDEFLGYQIGTEFTRHYQVVNYFTHLAENSTQINFASYGKTNEGRMLTYALVSSKENLKNIEQIRTAHLQQTGILEGESNPETAIVWLSYNVHGNEASGTEAAMQTAYELITNYTDVLKNTVVIIDPCINPDGRDRYVNWYNQIKATPYSPYQDAVEHDEPWVSGRPNHYLFDLNRDWMWASQVETRQRLAIYNQWMPHIHVDFHEQGINEPYYFAPAAEPFHEIITDFQLKFQTEIGKNNAAAFDEKAWSYFTRERFDLLYPSYGDTYPTYNGAIGMTYEQAGNGRAGLGINTDDGYVLTLVDRVKHHVTSGLTTVKTASTSAKELNKEFKNYFQHNSSFDYYVLKGEQQKLKTITQLFDLHQIKYSYTNPQSLKVNNVFEGTKQTIDLKDAIVVSAKQPKAKLLKVLFEKNTSLSTPLTYDITSWNLALAHGIELYTLNGNISLKEKNEKNINKLSTDRTVGYIAPWKSLEDAKFLAQLLQHGVEVKATTKPIKIANKQHERGSLIVTNTNNKELKLDSLITSLANQFQIELQTTQTSFSDSGTDFGSPDVKKIHPQRIALLRDGKVSTLSYGSLWYFFEQDLHYPIISVSSDKVHTLELNNYDVLLLPSGNYDSILKEKNAKQLLAWVKKGGKIIAIGNALNSFAGKENFGLDKSEKNEQTKKENDNLISFANREIEQTKDNITGAIFKVKLDHTHPLAFGFNEDYYSLKTSANAYAYLKKGYNVGYLDETCKPISGFVGEKAEEKIKKSLVFGEYPIGKGSIIYLVDEVNFRSFWQNGKLFIANALFMVNNQSNQFK